MEEVPQNAMLWVTGMAGALFDYYHRHPYRAIRFNDHDHNDHARPPCDGRGVIDASGGGKYHEP